MWTNLVRLNANSTLMHSPQIWKRKWFVFLATAHKQSQHRQPRTDCLLAMSNQGESLWRLTQMRWKQHIKSFFLSFLFFNESHPFSRGGPTWGRRETLLYIPAEMRPLSWTQWVASNEPCCILYGPDSACVLCVCSDYRHRDALWGPEALTLHPHLR